MLRIVFTVVVRKFVHGQVFGRRKHFLLLISLLVCFLLLWHMCGWLILVSSRALLLPPPPDQDLDHFRRSRNLADYLSNIQVLIEPSSAPCALVEDVPLIVLVASAPQRFENRQAVRETWGKHQPTYFVLGLQGNAVDEQLVDNYIEAKEYSDLVVFDFRDHYQNLTLKTALMMQWTQDRCPQAQFLLKTDDDVLVNPWILGTVLKENPDAKFIGYRINNTQVHRDEYTKWYMPRWVYNQDTVPQYLSGTSYLVTVERLHQILKKANRVPLVNLEDVYFTYIVANRNLGYSLTHDRRLSPFKPWISIACAHWSLAASHSMTPSEMVSAWSKIESVAKENNTCAFFNTYLNSDFLLY